jgi:membrane-bound serine protease (ClpP class)
MARVELVWIITAIGVGLLLVELLAPTGGVLAVLGAAGLVAAGIVALGEDSDLSDYLGPGLITLGVLSLISSIVIGRKVLAAHTEQPVRTGWEELVGRDAVVRDALDPVGQIWIEGALWKARADGEGRIEEGNRVRIDGVDGLTLVVSPLRRSGESERGE